MRRRAYLLIALASVFTMTIAHARGDERPLDTAWLDAAWDFDRPAESEARFRRELGSLPEHAAARIELSTQIARAQALDRRFDAAHATLDDVKEDLAGRPPRVAVRYLLERGRVFNSSGAPERAVPLFRAALDKARQAHEDFLAIDAAHMLGIAAPAEGRLEWNLQALAMTERTQDARSKRWLASLYNNIGWTYHDRGDYSTALAYFEKALPAWQARGGADKVRIAYWSIARAYRSLGRLDDALAIQERLAREAADAGAPDGYIYEELGELMLAKGDAAAARPNFARAYALLERDKGLQAEAPERLARLKRLGGVE
ncbi:MAG TPA: tetratricopeptide repeat protein [Casimicrobiaceae bacterium]|nr:tetratricopeptide repeat protein [Casimicrobiaceae bacterium]